MDRPNLTVLTNALVTKLTLEESEPAAWRSLLTENSTHYGWTRGLFCRWARCTREGADASGIGDEEELQRLGIPVVQHLPGVGQNFQDHFGIGCVWEYQQPLLYATTQVRQRSSGKASWSCHSGFADCLGEVPICSARQPPSSIHRRLLDVVWRSRAPEKPGSDPLDGT